MDHAKNSSVFKITGTLLALIGTAFCRSDLALASSEWKLGPEKSLLAVRELVERYAMEKLNGIDGWELSELTSKTVREAFVPELSANYKATTDMALTEERGHRQKRLACQFAIRVFVDPLRKRGPDEFILDERRSESGLELQMVAQLKGDCFARALGVTYPGAH